MINKIGTALQNNIAFSMVRNAQASIALYQNFTDGDLAKFLVRDSFNTVAQALAEKYFPQMKDMAVFAEIILLYVMHLIMAPILQRITRSAGYDWNAGHLLSQFRRECSGRNKRHYFGVHPFTTSYHPNFLEYGISSLRINDTVFITELLDLYKKNCGGTRLRHQLARLLFDPILGIAAALFHEYRYGNCLYRLDMEPFEGSIDLRESWGTVYLYEVRVCELNGRYTMEIKLSDDFVKAFKKRIEAALLSGGKPALKYDHIKSHIFDFVERARWARTAKPQILELRSWMASKIRALSDTYQSAVALPDILVSNWLQRVDCEQYFRKPTFFLDRNEVGYERYLVLFSPYREAQYGIDYTQE
jgi:hypothetical protein